MPAVTNVTSRVLRMGSGGVVARLATCLVLGAWAAPLAAQGPSTGTVTVFGSLRTRIESWNWFGDSPEGRYTYPGSLARLAVARSKRTLDWQLELAVPFIFGLPDRALAPGAQGALGFGANYYIANENSTRAAMPFLKQALVRFKGFAGVDGQSLKIGRMEVVDGAEVTPKDATLAALKRDRIAHRLLGNFGFSHVGRSLDGAQYTFDRPGLNVTIVGGRPTRGVFQVDGWGELNATIVYGALTGQTGGATNAGEWRLFALTYVDHRNDVLKVDNRLLAMRRVDAESIGVATVGGHFLHLVETPAGVVDMLAWGALQAGAWGTLSHRAVAFAGEVGWQPRMAAKLRLWLRGGYGYASGDGDPDDERHGTFFQVLPTPRVYARFPFFNLMNIEDGFGELIIRPSTRLAVRTDAHVLRLADRNDLWYQGGGAFQQGSFGYTGRPAGGRSGLAALYDASGDYTVNAHLTIGAYYGYAAGEQVVQAIYPTGRGARFSYVELVARF